MWLGVIYLATLWRLEEPGEMLALGNILKQGNSGTVRRPSDSSSTSGALTNGQKDAARILDHINALLADVECLRDRLPLTVDGKYGIAFYNAAADGTLSWYNNCCP